MKDMGFNEKGELKRLVEDDEDQFQLREESKEGEEIEMVTSDSIIHRSSKVVEAALDNIDTHIAI